MIILFHREKDREDEESVIWIAYVAAKMGKLNINSYKISDAERGLFGRSRNP